MFHHNMIIMVTTKTYTLLHVSCIRMIFLRNRVVKNTLHQLSVMEVSIFMQISLLCCLSNHYKLQAIQVWLKLSM